MIRKVIFLLTVFWGITLAVCAQAPSPNFTADGVAGCSPLVVAFTDQSMGAPTAWSWDFGNGATSTLKNPSTTFFTPGTYTVSLTVTNADGSKTLSRPQYITVYGTPEVAFSVPDSTGCYPFPVQYSDVSQASAGTTNTGWVWDLGDGTQTTEKNPATVYQNSGSYTVSLRVVNDKGCWGTATKQAFIKINGGVVPGFSFVAPAVCHTPFVFQFQNTSTGPGQLSYTWLFGDGNTATDPSPVHSYTTDGTFGVTLIAKSSEGCVDTLKKEDLLKLHNTTTSFSVADSVCVGDAVKFTNVSSAPALSSSWSFGDGTASAAASPVKTFLKPGVYTVKLQQSYGFCTDSAAKDIAVFPRPVAGFTADTITNCQPPLTVRFKNTSTGAAHYQWNFGDGNTSADASPSHTYTTYGSFAVTLTVTNESGCTDTYRLPGPVYINKPLIKFPSMPREGCVPLPVSFSADITAPDPVVAYLWDFGNGSTSTEATPSFTYTAPGTYPVKLTVTTNSGCTETFELKNAVRAGQKPVVSFEALPTTVCAFQSVQFTNTTSGGGSWEWHFGDKSTSSLQNPTHFYSDTGTLTVKLIASNNGCKDSFERKDYVTIKPPIAGFRYRTTCTNKLFYTFTDRSVGAKTWQWDFGDGTTSSDPNPTHTFPTYGTYTVQLTVTNDTCFHQSKQIIRIVDGTPEFTAVPPVACKGTPIRFTADSTNAANIVSYRWNFGTGIPAGSGRSATAVFPRSGTYNVSLTVRDINGCVDSTTKKQAVQIGGPVAGITATNNTGCRGLEALFTDASKDDGQAKIKAWQWNLGDGTVVDQETPALIRHRYARAGTYDVSLLVTDTAGCTDRLLLRSLVRTSDITANFVSADTLSCPGAAIRFTNTSKALTSYTSLWSFGNGTTSQQQHAQAAYMADGLYSVMLKITDAYGCTDSLMRQQYISINRPVAAFTVNDSTSSCTPFQVRYTNQSTYYTHHVWNLNGGTSRLLHPTQFYNTAGIYETKLVVTSHGGCTDTARKTISVYDIGATKLSYLPLSGCKPLVVDLTATTPIKMTYIWDFGDGNILSSQDTASRHVYQSFGDFVPKIIMRTSDGCVVAIPGTDTIRIKGANVKFGLSNRQFCDSGTVRFSDSTTFNNPVSVYHWNFGDGTTSALPSPSHFYAQPGLYPVSLSVQTQNACVDTFRLHYPIRVVASPAIRIAGDSVICAGEGITHLGLYERTDTAQVQWAWRFPNGNRAGVQMPPRQQYGTPGTFRVEAVAVNSNGCRDTALQTIYVNPIPEVTLPGVITTTAGTPVLLPAVYSDTMKLYQWQGTESLSCTTCPQPMAMPRMDTRYTVHFTNRFGCSNEGSVRVVVICNNDNVFLPNTFSPNADGSNDVFYVRGKGLNRVKLLRIFNRWGQVVYEKTNFSVNDPAAGWDGTYKGAPPVPGVYVYQMAVFCDNSQVVTIDGNVALIQ